MSGQQGIIPALAGNTSSQAVGAIPNADHPRSRGEYWCRDFLDPRSKGSSPLSRGILARLYLLGPSWGIIPALAGNTSRIQTRGNRRWDHPRSRGEYSDQLVRSLNRLGSSPLSRGIRPKIALRRIGNRIIPALAGNTVVISSRIFAIWDHPRSRGEYAESLARTWAWFGSSPLSRGIPTAVNPRPVRRRIIPALAGNTPTRSPP